MTANMSQPHDPIAERALLGACLLDASGGRPEYRNAIVASINADDFYVESHRHIFRAYLANGEACDAVTLARWLRAADALDMAGGLAYLAELTTSVPTVRNWAHYAEIVREKARRRDVIAAALKAVAEARADDGLARDIGGELVRSVNSSLADARGATRWTYEETQRQVVTLAEEMNALRAAGRSAAIHCDVRGAGGVTLGEMVPVYRGQLTLLGGTGGTGKTTTAMQLLRGAASGHRKGLPDVDGQPSSFISVELRQRIAAMRCVCRAAGVPERRLLDGLLTDSDFTKLTNHIQDHRHWPLYIDRPIRGHWPLVEQSVRAAVACDNVEFVAIDHLHRCRWPEIGRDRREQFIAMSQSAADLAAELNVGILLLVQLVKVPEGEVPTARHIKEASDIVEAADWAALLNRPHRGDEQKDNVIDIVDAKGRFSPEGEAKRFGWVHGEITDLSKVGGF